MLHTLVSFTIGNQPPNRKIKKISAWTCLTELAANSLCLKKPPIVYQAASFVNYSETKESSSTFSLDDSESIPMTRSRDAPFV